MKSVVSLALLLAITASLGGCGADALREDAASGVATTSAAVVAQANATIDQAKARRARAYDILIASDPNCPVAGDVYTFTPTGAPVPHAPIAPLCAKDAQSTFPGYRATKLNVVSIAPAALRPTVELIGTLADYEAALAKVVAETNPDLTKQLQGITDKANDARTIAELLSGSKLPAIPDLASKQAKAATDILQFVMDLDQQHGEVRQIRQIVIAQHQKIAQLAQSLQGQMDDWEKVTSLGYGEVIEANLRSIYTREKNNADFAARLQMLTTIRQAQADIASIPEISKTLKKAIDKFSDADKLLGDRLDGKFSAEDRKKAADLSLKQIFDGLHLIASAVTAWGFV